MKNRRAHRLVVRRFIVGLMAALIGGVGSLATATPSRADIPCALTYTVTAWGDPAAPQYYVNAEIKNTGPTTSINWVVYISFPPDTTTQLYWSVNPMPMYGDGWYTGVAWNKAILPGHTANFGFVVVPPPGVVGRPGTFVCSI